ncbi:LOW QUALITY PROTEIN: putrescine hydroxycinnamoyltransferase 1-like [Dioscorea cayenensis subsp. rotundata]|uniref:LOW QUALITY PROTEIN: putrescine hydroxycinnamoyltransferase 1-like n=1 Tax=Dioscorea cayennensis subsp. rotundata TaxID=55577 RepID=A0AB40BVG0_DIOCR|nr:LOW QUALITY PROTEIN: putrescine hydroxycinnamoyltransferase 1-like [Dioscorea cayenensis subsp. rotundata]
MHEETPKHKLWLSNVDVFASRDHVPTVYLYKPNGDQDFFSIEILKNALSKVLVTFYPLAVARAECTIDGFNDFRPSMAVRQLLVPLVNEPERSCMLALFQLTLFKCGGVCLGCAIHHSVTDGVSAVHFINAWSDIARGLDIISVPPFLDRTVLRARSPPAVSFDHIEYTNDELYSKLKSLDDLGQECEISILTISKDQLNTLKYGFKGERSLSTFKAVGASLVYSVQGLPEEQYTRFYVHADARSRLKPPLPAGYFGNAILRIGSHLRVGDLVLKPFEFGISKLDETIKNLDDEYIHSLMDLLEIHKGDKKKVLGSRSVKMTDFIVASWLALPLYEANFGWGKPWFMGRASMRYVGQAYVMRSGPGNDGGVSIAIAFESANMAPFKEIFYRDLGSQVV